MAYLDNTGVGTLWSRIKTYISGLGYTSNVGTVTGVKMNNGSVISPVNGVVDLGNVVTDVSSKEDASNKVTSLSSSSTDTQYPSAKAVYDLVGDIETILASI